MMNSEHSQGAKVLITGSGGREHAIAWKLAASPHVAKIYIAPGNGGTALEAKCENVDIDVDDVQELFKFARDTGIDYTVVGPEIPLALGIVDFFEANGMKIFGPCQGAAQLEASKSFAKDLMTRAGVPTAKYKEFRRITEAKHYIHEQGVPIVIKADGLAAGKGVTVARTEKEAMDALEDILVKKVFGAACSKVVIEQCLTGQEVSYLVMTDGKTVIPLASTQDHKAVYDGDQGPNTGGMGAYSPAPVLADDQYAKVTDTVIWPVLKELERRGIDYKGILYAGLMVSDDGDINVIEFNARFGDPETQVLLPKMSSDLHEHFMAVMEDRLAGEHITWHEGSVATVVLASGGYPSDYKKGLPISGIEQAEQVPDVKVFHAGTSLVDQQITTPMRGIYLLEEHLVSAGGRVLNVTATGENLRAALDKIYKAIGSIHFQDMHYRKDIGHRAL
jgi:phosphoribosylamine--glycine ligase